MNHGSRQLNSDGVIYKKHKLKKKEKIRNSFYLLILGKMKTATIKICE